MVYETYDISSDTGVMEFGKIFYDEIFCLKYLEKLRWGGNIISPFNSESKVYACAGDKYKCKATGKYFNARTQTLFDNSKLPLSEIFFLIYSFAAYKKNISSHQHSRTSNITQKTAWEMCHKIKGVFSEDIDKLKGVVEVDECFVSKGNQWTRWGGISTRKTPIFGLIERGGKVIIKCIEDRNRATIHSMIKKYVEPGSIVYSDGHASYKKLDDNYEHDYVEHSTNEYVRGDVHTNNIENVWRYFKSAVRNAHHSVSAKYIQLYCDEAQWRFNNRNKSIMERFDDILYRMINTQKTKKIKTNV